MTIAVGAHAFDRPDLVRRPEYIIDLKQKICGEPPEYGSAVKINKHYAALLGCKFNRRFQAANYWLWVGNRMTPRAANLLRHEGKHWKVYNNDLVFRANNVLPYVNEAERDGLYNLVPIIVAFGTSPQEIRQVLGRGAWRRVANNSMSRNRLLMNATNRAGVEPETFVRLLEFPSGVLRFTGSASDIEVIAARITPRKRGIEFRATIHMVRDTQDMLGVAFNPLWSYARMYDEHERATKNIMRGRFSDKTFAPEWAYEADGFRASLLNSQLEIAAEGKVQHHCIASYAKRSASGKYAVLKIEGKERATAGLLVNGAIRIDQVYAACNQMVSSECMEFAEAAARKFAEAKNSLERSPDVSCRE